MLFALYLTTIMISSKSRSFSSLWEKLKSHSSQQPGPVCAMVCTCSPMRTVEITHFPDLFMRFPATASAAGELFLFWRLHRHHE